MKEYNNSPSHTPALNNRAFEIYEKMTEEAEIEKANRKAMPKKKDPLDFTRKRRAKEGMNLEKKIQKQWNSKMNTKKKKPTSNPRLNIADLLDEEEVEIEEKDTSTPSLVVPDIIISRKPKTKVKKTYGESKQDEAQRQLNSGALWFAKGDIKLEHALMEVKERGTMNGRGEKQITIPREWLIKQADEAFLEGKPFWYLPFAYKNDEAVYLIKPYDHELEMVQDLRRLEEENIKLKEIIKESESLS